MTAFRFQLFEQFLVFLLQAFDDLLAEVGSLRKLFFDLFMDVDVSAQLFDFCLLGVHFFEQFFGLL